MNQAQRARWLLGAVIVVALAFLLAQCAEDDDSGSSSNSGKAQVTIRMQNVQ